MSLVLTPPFDLLSLLFTPSHGRDSKLIRSHSPYIPAYTEVCSELEQYQRTFKPPYLSRPVSGFLLVSFSGVTRHVLPRFVSTLSPSHSRRRLTTSQS